MRERIQIWKAFVRQRIEYWRFAEELASGVGLMRDAPYCALKRVEFEELLSCLEEMERVAA